MTELPVIEAADDVAARLARVEEQVEALDRLLDAKFVRIEAMIRYEADKVALALSASDKAITKAEVATEKRLESVNEFRAQLTDQAKTFLLKEAFDTFASLSSRDREDLHREISVLQLDLRKTASDLTLAQTQLMSREQVLDSMKVIDASVTRNREDLQMLRTQQTRMVGVAIGISTAISMIGILAAIVFRLASGQ